jgi:hypothetical protein
MGIKRFPARPRAATVYLAARLRRAGQVTVELLLVLPVFMLLLFFIMEMGNLGFHTILAHHCAYEMARVGSLVAGPNAGNISSGSDKSRADEKMGKVLEKMFPNTPGVKVESTIMQTLKDPQSGQMGEDLLVTLTYPGLPGFELCAVRPAQAGAQEEDHSEGQDADRKTFLQVRFIDLIRI